MAEYIVEPMPGNEWGVMREGDESYVLIARDRPRAEYAALLLNEGGLPAPSPLHTLNPEMVRQFGAGTLLRMERDDFLTYAITSVECARCGRTRFRGEMDASGRCPDCVS
jgi:hypothetical protein